MTIAKSFLNMHKTNIYTSIMTWSIYIIHNDAVFINACAYIVYIWQRNITYTLTIRISDKQHSQKAPYRLDASCGFYRPDASCQQVVSSLLTSSRLRTSDLLQLDIADLLQVDKTTCIKPIHAVRNLQQVC